MTVIMQDKFVRKMNLVRPSNNYASSMSTNRIFVGAAFEERNNDILVAMPSFKIFPT
jgi:hypothetical protein